MALLHMVSMQTKDFGVAHVNHNFRPESENDLEFVRNYTERLGAPFYTYTLAPLDSGNKEEFGRNERYKFFKEVREKEGYDWVLTAHHRDDVIESFLMQIFFGRRVYGIAAEDQKRKLLRPILNLTRDEINDYVKVNEIPFVEDPTNEETTLLRNKIRHTLIPNLKSMFGDQVAGSIFESLREINDLQLALEWALKVPQGEFGTKEFLKKLKVELEVLPQFLKPYLIEKALLPVLNYRLGKSHRDRALYFFTSNSPEIQLPRGITLRRQGGGVVVMKK